MAVMKIEICGGRMHVYVSQAFIGYLATLFGARTGDLNYVAEFDVDGDGVIGAADIGWFARRFESWVELGMPSLIVVAGAAITGLFTGFILSRVL